MNVYKQLIDLLPEADQLQVGTVQSVAGGHSVLVTLSGGTIKVLGDDVAVGQKAYFKGGRLEGAAPELPTYEIEV